MRDDLDKAITERPRNGGSRKFPRRIKHKGKLEELDLVSIKTGIKKAYGTNAETHDRNTKSFNDLLAPIYGLINKNVGKNWDKLFSELRKQFKPDSVVHQHIYGHLFQFIQIHTRKNGNVVEYNAGDKRRWRQEAWNPIDEHVEFYVHPVSKCIIKNKLHKTWRQKNRERAKNRLDEKEVLRYQINENLELYKLDGIWYGFEFALTPPGTFTEHKRVDDDGVKYIEVAYHSELITDVLSSALWTENQRIEGSGPPYYRLVQFNGFKTFEMKSGNPLHSECTSRDRRTENRYRYAKTKRQLSHQELKKYDLL